MDRISIRPPSSRIRLMAALLYTVTHDKDLSLSWVRRAQTKQVANCGGLCPIVSLDDIIRWTSEAGADATYCQAARQPKHPWRQELQWYIVEHDVASEVREMVNSGLRIPAWYVTQCIVRKWSPLPQSDHTAGRLERIRAGGTSAKNYMRLFRAAWGFRWGVIVDGRRLSVGDAIRRAAVFVRWCGWLRAHLLSHSEYVIINMDETCLSNIREWKTSLMVEGDSSGRPHWPQKRPALASPRTSLLAAVCNNAELQKLLPQIWIPRTPKGAMVSWRTRWKYFCVKRPQEIWMGTDGIVTGSLIRRWLTKLRSVVRAWNPAVRVVLAIDVCRAHISRDVVVHSRRLGFEVVFIPAKMTWLLQPLDTHVFAQLKRSIRNGLFRRIVASSSRRLFARDAIAVKAAAIDEVLVTGDWCSIFSRIGMDGCLDTVRPAVRHLLSGIDLAPRAPTAPELKDLLSCSTRCSKSIWSILLGRAPPLPASEAAGALGAGTTGLAGPPISGTAAVPPAHPAGGVRAESRRAPRGYRLFPRARPAMPAGARLAPFVVLPPIGPAEDGHAMTTRSKARLASEHSHVDAKRLRPDS